MEKKILILITIVLPLGILTVFSFKDFLIKDSPIENKTPESKIVTKGNFILEYTYKGENIWEYSVTGQLPNPCYQASTDVIVAESYPEQVFVTVTVAPPEDDVMCAQVISEYEYSGEFSASKEATVALQVK
ncbi:hypothetical protein CVU76_02525 [Candidatus Dojkabacteria bacterium HGW-Dojkabacteria-1]|uniref:Proteinase inhibitor I42 chagasin domain-containing protein n=1 Tax=Candidatus Dojkabacteria bacterium HGW-Dojkabacteria-1 TaxID=2013761 RepID=A0A2N2F3Y3_9BACT|nr:MAG: hypothetical protein CVU76_02525 [Candidatus Dojkabacteria bacterium HGW-Dojkabacteria-1]